MDTGGVWLLSAAFLIVVLILGGAEAQQGKSHQTLEWCRSGVCYHLYTFNGTAGDTWTTANEQCEVHGLHLTAVWDQKTQDAVNGPPPLANTVNAWLAGRRSDNDTFIWLNDQVYQGLLLSNFTCGSVYQKIPTARQCNTSYTCLCERDKDPDCAFDEALLGNKCIWSSTPSATWYDCRNRCIGAGGDLASLPHDLDKVIDDLTDKTGIDHHNMYLWIGLNKRPWSWISGTGQSSSLRTHMKYYHFGANNGVVDAYKCIYVNMANTDRVWIDTVCHTLLDSFICDDGPVPAVPSPRPTTIATNTNTAATTEATTVTPTAGNTINVSDVTEPDQEEEADNTNVLTVGALVGIVLGCVTAGAVLAVGLQAAYIVVKRTSKPGDPADIHEQANENLTNAASDGSSSGRGADRRPAQDADANPTSVITGNSHSRPTKPNHTAHSLAAKGGSNSGPGADSKHTDTSDALYEEESSSGQGANSEHQDTRENIYQENEGTANVVVRPSVPPPPVRLQVPSAKCTPSPDTESNRDSTA